MDALSRSPLCKHTFRNGVCCPTLMTLVELVVFVIDIDARFATTNQPPLPHLLSKYWDPDIEPHLSSRMYTPR